MLKGTWSRGNGFTTSSQRHYLVQIPDAEIRRGKLTLENTGTQPKRKVYA